jgi:pimeloyl-ACP methyl ester carboxylesterase
MPSFAQDGEPAATGTAALGDFAGRVDIGGRSLFLHCIGRGSPTVILEVGWPGDGSLSSSEWDKVQPNVALMTRVCSYDRAGTGQSDPPPSGTRTVDDVVDDLHALLSAAGVAGPYVLVGHSFGGFVIRVFAGRYPDEIAGLVFVDSAQPRFFERIAHLLPPPPAEGEQGPPPPPDPEGIDIMTSQELADAAPLPPAIPVVVLTHGGTWGTPPGIPYLETEAIWQDLQAELAARYGGRLIQAENAGHFIHRDRPDYVIEAITWTVAAGWHPDLWESTMEGETDTPAA